jgi:hypothetical protein
VLVPLSTLVSRSNSIPLPVNNFHNITQILERVQSKVLRMIAHAPWYVPNTLIRRDLRRYSSQYSTRLSSHLNDLTVNVMELPDNRRL